MWSFILLLLYVFVMRYLGQGAFIKIRNKSGACNLKIWQSVLVTVRYVKITGVSTLSRWNSVSCNAKQPLLQAYVAQRVLVG